jgi:hypothetical protein
VQDRPRVWLLGVLLALPLAGLVLLLAVPSIDVEWEHHPSHFLLVSVVALINVALALVASEAAHRRADARLFLVSLALIASSGSSRSTRSRRRRSCSTIRTPAS